MSKQTISPAIILAPGREKALKRQHPWIFSNAISQVISTPNSGDIVDVLSSKGEWLARAAYSPRSQIRARVWTFVQEQAIDAQFFYNTLATAWQLRQRLFDQQSTNAVRLIAGESDGLPGITIDKYTDVLVCQLLSAGAEASRKLLLAALIQLFPEHSIYERSDADVRKKEGLEPTTGWLHLPRSNGEVIITEHGMALLVDVINGHKTGFYLDQRANRQAVKRYAKGKTVLNCFSYTGTFAVAALQGGASKVTNIDLSELALATAHRNAQLNHLALSAIEQVKADVFKQLRHYREQGVQFDMVVLDPPKFADNKSQLVGACRGYKDINMIAMQLVKPGGLLFTFSCSGLMEDSLFQKVVADAALDAKRHCQFLERLQQDSDHPVLSTFPEGHYLKGLICTLG
jgi:23S rRNA (cytosine1962-C5)-methyltransferase